MRIGQSARTFAKGTARLSRADPRGIHPRSLALDTGLLPFLGQGAATAAGRAMHGSRVLAEGAVTAAGQHEGPVRIEHPFRPGE